MFIVLWLILHSLLFILSFFAVKNSKEKHTFIYPWALFCGSFVWEDLLVFSLFNVFLAICTFYFNDYRIFFLAILMFGVVRSFGEVFYFLLQQFIKPNFHPHNIGNHFGILKHLLGDISDQKCFILLQVFFQTLLVFFSTLLILLLLNWNTFFLQKIY